MAQYRMMILIGADTRTRGLKGVRPIVIEMAIDIIRTTHNIKLRVSRSSSGMSFSIKLNIIITGLYS